MILVTLGGMFDAPIAEVSGACFADGRLVLVGDAQPLVAWAPWTADGPGSWETLDVAALPGAPEGTGQFEAVEHLRDDVVVILCEEPALLVAVDLSAERITGWWHLEVDLAGLAKPWRKDPNSHGEGFFFGPDRLFVVKEKKPAALVEFGLPGQQSVQEPRPGTWEPPASGSLVALSWSPLDLEDISDVCVADQRIWLLSDKSRAIMPLGDEPRDLPPQISKPEGLARTPEGRWLVAVDNKDGENALFVVDLS
jgi:uncharacterized protein YjiK